MVARLPRELTRKHSALSYERAELRARLSRVEDELRALDYAIAVLDPEWKPSGKLRKPRAPARWPRGTLTTTCLRLLRQQPGLSATELAKLVAPQCGIVLTTRDQRHDLASAITMSLRRYERKGLVEIAGKEESTGALRWRICALSGGRVGVA